MPVPVTEKVSTEDAEIYCECRGIGPTLLLIHDAMEDTGFYSSAAQILSGEFTVVIFLTGGATRKAQGIEIPTCQ